MRAEYGKSTRQFFAESHTPLKLLELGKDVFENAIVDSSILLLREGKHRDPCMTVDMDQFNVDEFPPTIDTGDVFGRTARNRGQCCRGSNSVSWTRWSTLVFP